MDYFYDSYAIIEFVNGNPKFKNYFLNAEGVTTLYNVMEVYYSALRTKDEKKAKILLEFLRPLTIHPDFDDIEESMKFRLYHKKNKLSYTDCIGYILAKKYGVKFLTGDEGFRNLPNVEFIKA